MSYDSEFQKMMVADRSRRSRTNGFQGCKNLGKGCDFDGFYLATYSPEGLCSKCELKEFPFRYQGCAFCGEAIRYSIFCWGCERGVAKGDFLNGHSTSFIIKIEIARVQQVAMK
jgi:hypothetical protein